MSADTGLTLHLSGGHLEQILRALRGAGWGHHDGLTEFLPLHDDGMYNWQKAALSQEALSAILCEKQRLHETIGMILYYKNTETGIMLLTRDADEIQFGLDIGRRMIADGMTDVSWYLEHVVLPLKRAGIRISSVEFRESR